jgi:hypothetical protein
MNGTPHIDPLIVKGPFLWPSVRVNSVLQGRQCVSAWSLKVIV